MTDPGTPGNESIAAANGRPGVLTHALRILGVVAGFSLFGWCLVLAFGNEQNRDGLKRLGQAGPTEVALLIGLALLAIVLNGLVFWATLAPVKRLRVLDVIAVNAIATFLASLPFKISVMVRVAIHRKRDGVELATMGPWFAAMAMMMLGSLGPVAVASVAVGEINARWLGIMGGLTVASWAITVLLARGVADGRGLRILRAIASRQPVRAIEHALHAPVMTKLDGGLAMLTNPWRVASIMGLRLIDIASLAARFSIAAAVLGQPIPLDDAVIVSVTFFVISVVSPTGTLGAREAGSAGVLGLIAGEADLTPFVLLPVVVSGAELLVNIAAATLGAIWLRPDKMLKGEDPTADQAPTVANESRTQ